MKERDIASAVQLIPKGHPGSSPYDWRARPFTIEWADGERAVSVSERRYAKDARLPVARATFACSGKHAVVGKTKRGVGENAGPKISRGHVCQGSAGGNVKLLVSNVIVPRPIASNIAFLG